MAGEASAEVAAAPEAAPAAAPDTSSAPPPEAGGETPPAEGTPTAPADASAEGDDWDLEVPEDKYVPRELIQEARNRYTNERLKRKEYDQLLEEWGGKDSVSEAVDFYKHIQTEEGVIDVFLEAAKSLGIGTKQLEALFGEMGGQAPPAAGQPSSDLEDDDERVLTLGEARELLAREVQQPLEQERQAQATARAQAVVSGLLKELSVPDDAVMDVLQLGDKYLPEGSLDPDQVSAAVRRGYADWVKLGEKASQEYLKKKAEAANGVPAAGVAGSAPASVPPEGPKSVEEAKARVREKLRASVTG